VGEALTDATTTIEVTDLTEVIGDGAVKCEWNARTLFPRCTKEARWAGVAQPCGHQLLMCPEHKLKSMLNAMEMELDDYFLSCNLGGPDHPVDRIEWRIL
jgi:hypothetical protein